MSNYFTMGRDSNGVTDFSTGVSENTFFFALTVLDGHILFEIPSWADKMLITPEGGAQVLFSGRLSAPTVETSPPFTAQPGGAIATPRMITISDITFEKVLPTDPNKLSMIAVRDGLVIIEFRTTLTHKEINP